MLKPISLTRKILFLPLILSAILALFSCSYGKVDPFDRLTGLSRAESKDAMILNREDEKKKKASRAKDEAPIPNVSKLIMTPPPPVIGGDKTISFSVTDQVPLKDVLIELGRVSQIDVDLDPTISGGIIVNAKNRPLKEVIDRIATLGGLRYSYKNGVLHFERDAPYMKNYFVDYLTGGTVWTEVESNITALLNQSSSSNTTEKSSFTSNKSAGIISIFATEKQHDVITKYLADVEKYASAQVLIEAKVVEVTLNDSFKTGIDWSTIGKKNTVTATNSGTSYTAFSYVTREIFNTDLTASISALETFGTAKAISSPRINAMNNQKATLNFSEQLVYFTISTSQSTTASASTNNAVVATVTATKTEVPIGVQLSITPSINLTTNEITLDIQPKLSVDSGRTVNDPSVNPNTGASLGNKVPIIKTRELNTIAKVQSGNILVIGGLMSDTTTNDDSGVPFLSRIPVLGWFFKSISKSSSVVETVIFIKATIVNSGTTPGKVDREFQEKFDPSKRKFFN